LAPDSDDDNDNRFADNDIISCMETRATANPISHRGTLGPRAPMSFRPRLERRFRIPITSHWPLATVFFPVLRSFASPRETQTPAARSSEGKAFAVLAEGGEVVASLVVNVDFAANLPKTAQGRNRDIVQC